MVFFFADLVGFQLRVSERLWESHYDSCFKFLDSNGVPVEGSVCSLSAMLYIYILVLRCLSRSGLSVSLYIYLWFSYIFIFLVVFVVFLLYISAAVFFPLRYTWVTCSLVTRSYDHGTAPAQIFQVFLVILAEPAWPSRFLIVLVAPRYVCLSLRTEVKKKQICFFLVPKNSQS